MKYLLIIILSCLVFSVKGQKLETLPSGLLTSGSGKLTISTGVTQRGTAWVDSATATYDTIPVIMLVTRDDDADSGMKMNMLVIPYAMQKRGYEVRAVTTANNWDGVIDPGMTPGWKPQSWKEYEHIAFLDQYKHPLEKYIIVWQTHPL